VTARRPVVVALGTVDPTLVTGVLGDTAEFVAQPGPEDLAVAEGAIVRADAVVDAALLAAGVDALEAGWIAEACTTSLHVHRPVRMKEVRT